MTSINDLPPAEGAFWNPFRAPDPIPGEQHDLYLRRLFKAFEDYANEWFDAARGLMANGPDLRYYHRP